MKRLLCVILAFGAITSARGEGISLKTDKEKFSYAIGIQIGQSIIRKGVDLDPDAFNLAIRDAVDGSKPRLSPEELQRASSKGETAVSEGLRERAKANLNTGRAFLADNKQKEGVVALSSGLQYKVLRTGAGEFPKPSSTVVVHYVGTLIDGREFDSSRRRGEPATFVVNKVVKGWQEAIPLMRVGSRWKVFIPPNLAYGVKGAGAVIGPNETLIFEIELLDIAK
jgi:FKBP-type peptidyl-prolyl cis-trans isomerase FklB